MVYGDGETAPSPKQAKYNDALATLQRIDEIWKGAYRHARSGKYEAWNQDLDAVWRELSEDVKTKSDEEKAFQKINTELHKEGLLNLPSKTGFKKTTSGDREKQTKIYQLLSRKEVFLRRLKSKQGKGTQFEDDTEEYTR